MVRPELHDTRRPFFDCTSYRGKPQAKVATQSDYDLHLHAKLTRSLPVQTIRYNDIRVALRLAA